MYQFLTDNPSYVVLAVAIIVFAGIGIYLNRIDSKISKLEKRISGMKKEGDE